MSVIVNFCFVFCCRTWSVLYFRWSHFTSKSSQSKINCIMACCWWFCVIAFVQDPTVISDVWLSKDVKNMWLICNGFFIFHLFRLRWLFLEMQKIHQHPKFIWDWFLLNFYFQGKKNIKYVAFKSYHIIGVLPGFDSISLKHSAMIVIILFELHFTPLRP